MPAPQRALVVVPGGDEIGELLELVRATRGQLLERRVLAATLTTLAAWLGEQARLLGQPEDGDETSNVRVLPPRSRVACLTRREQEVASRIARGASNRQIAEELFNETATTE